MLNIEIIRSNRKTVAIEIKADMRLIVRAPLRMSKADIDKFIIDKTPWIESHLQRMRERGEGEPVQPFTNTEIRELADRALDVIPKRAEELAREIGVSYGRITIKNQVTRWGSCSAKKNLNFNCLLMLCPDEVLDYVIVHELCHLLHMDHSKEFWAEVERHCPDWRTHRDWLKTNGNTLIRRLQNG